MDKIEKILKEIDQYIIAYSTPPTGREVAGTRELLGRCRDLIRQLSEEETAFPKDKEFTEHGAFARNNITGKEDLLTQTFYSELLCRDRALKKIDTMNSYGNVVYDPDLLRIRCRIVRYGKWQDIPALPE